MKKRWLLALALVLLGAVAVLVARRGPPAVVQAKAAPAQANLAHVVDSGVAAAADMHAKLVQETQQLPVPTLAAANAAQAPGQVQALAIDTMKQQPAADDVSLEQAVFIGFTGNVIGETDPCG